MKLLVAIAAVVVLVCIVTQLCAYDSTAALSPISTPTPGIPTSIECPFPEHPSCILEEPTAVPTVVPTLRSLPGRPRPEPF